MSKMISSLFAVGLLGTTGVAAAPTVASGDALFAAANFSAAESAYASTLRSEPHNVAANFAMARIALYRNQLDEAELHARAFAADAPSDRRANSLLRTIAERQNEGPDYRVTIADAEVDVPFESSDPLPEVRAIVDGKPANLVIDTGGPGLDLAASFVKALGIATEPAGQAAFAGGLRGDLRIGRIDKLDLGNASVRSIPIHVPPEMPPGIDGVIGTNVLYRFLSTIDYAKRRLVLRPKAASPRFEADAEARKAVILPMLLVPDHFIFARARIDNAPEALFSVDTGGPGIGVDLTKDELAAAAIVPDASHPGTFDGGGGTTRTLPYIADVTLGDRTFHKLPGVYLPGDKRTRIFPFTVAGTISQELFKRGALTFDFSAMKLVFDAPPEP
ncbi:MAG: aspartyl protease family protein [Candidatus Eremiobacteraeota bacterium]|nr:aspartyl protease family protein [Candidatus Eremiobacteraeota bacterium]